MLDANRRASDIKRHATVLKIKRDALAPAAAVGVSTMVVRHGDRTVVVGFLIKRR
jgi:hypothetical protein